MIVMVKVQDGKILSVRIYAGSSAAQQAAVDFEIYTGVVYKEFLDRLDQGEEASSILSSTFAGTVIMIDESPQIEQIPTIRTQQKEVNV